MPPLAKSLVAIAIAGYALAAQAADGQRTFTIGVENLQYAPLFTTSQGNEYNGFAREVLDAFAQEQGYTFRYVPLPVQRLLTVYLQDNNLDFKFPDNPAWQVQRKAGYEIAYSAPLIVSLEGAMVLPRNKGKPLNKLHSLGTVLGFTPHPYHTPLQAHRLSLTTAPSFEGLLRHALAGHVDAIYINIDVGRHLLADQLDRPDGLVFDPDLPHAPSNFSLSSRRHADVIEQFTRFLQRQRPLLQQLRAKYKIVDQPIT